MNEAVITYRNVIRDQKSLADYQAWMESFWPLQQAWGALAYELWQEGEHCICCRYTVQNIDRWNRLSSGPEAEALALSLDRIVHLDRVSLKITFPRNLPA